MVIKINYTSSDIYVSTNVSPVYVVVNYSAVNNGGGAVWGGITGTLSDQTDLQTALDSKFDDPTGTTSQYLRGDGSLATFPTIPGGTVTSVGLTMPSAFAVANSPVTSAGTLAVTGAGTAAQYVRGDGALATFPNTASGGSSVNYYLNGSVSASVTGYKQLANTAVIGAGTNFNLTGNGLIAQFLTDVGNPNRVEIPGGAWNFEMYFNSSSNGGNEAFYVELLKYNGTTFTSIATTSTNPESITGGTSTDLYLTSLAVPTTALLVTDRLAVRVYIVNNSGARTITLHTEDNNLCEILTTFAGGISSLNGLTANTQYFATGTSGTDFNISSATDTHTFNLPTASATNRGALSSADWSTFNNKVPPSRTLTINGTAFDLSADRSWTVSSDNIYTANGTLTANRTLTHGGFNLTLVGGTHTNRFTAAGRLLLGTTTESTFILDAVGSVKFGTAGTGTGMYWDNANNRLGIGTNTPTTTLDARGIISGTTTSVGNLLSLSGANNTSVLVYNDANGRMNLEVNGNTSATSNAGAYITAKGYQEAWVNLIANQATSGNRIWRFGNVGSGDINNLFAIQKLNDAGNAILSTALCIFSTTSNIGIGTTTDGGFKLDVNGSARVSGAVTSTLNQNASTLFTISNTTSGTGSEAACLFTSSSGSGSGSIGKASSLKTAYKTYLANDLLLYNGLTGGDISILNDFATGKIKFAAGASSTAQMTLTAAGRLLLGTTTESTDLFHNQGSSRLVGEVNFGNWKITSNGNIFETINSNAQIYWVGPIKLMGGNGNINIGSTFSNGITIGTGAASITSNIAIGTNSSSNLGKSVSIGNSSIANQSRRQLAIGSNSTVLHHSCIALNGAVTTATNQFVAGVMWYPLGNEESPIIDVYFGSGVQRQWYEGGGVQGSDGNGISYTIHGSGSLGTNFAGGNITIAGGKGTGSGTSGDVIISTATTTTSGTTLQSLTERLRVKGTQGSVRFIPIATPSSGEAGDVYYDSTTNKLRCYNGTTWNDLF